jgi:N utilization substance protein B
LNDECAKGALEPTLMLSRRNIRIKVMQVLYSMNRDPKLTLEKARKEYRLSIDRSFELYLFNLWELIQVARYALEDEARKNTKLLPSEEDKQFTAKLGRNPLIQSLIDNRLLRSEIEKRRIPQKTDLDIIRQLYAGFAETEAYKTYLQQKPTTNEDHLQAILALQKYCLQQELFTDLLEDHYTSWIDDKSLVVGAMKKTLKALPVSEDFLEDYLPSAEATTAFGERLLEVVAEGDEELLEMIEPTLKNWDAERVAVIDMILLKMALCELLNFPTIPTKVTLNEFVEISKLYSTDKSKDFINGILDRLMKKLNEDGRIFKEGRGLMD